MITNTTPKARLNKEITELNQAIDRYSRELHKKEKQLTNTRNALFFLTLLNLTIYSYLLIFKI